MKIQKIHIEQILGIDSLDIEPGAVTLIEGGNGAGKTSVLEAIRAAIGGGHDATLLRNGAEEGRTVLVLEDGTEVTKRVTASGSTVTVKHPEMGRVGSPQKYLDRLTDALALNPVALLVADPRTRTQAVLDSLPLELDPSQLREAVGDVLPVPGDIVGHPLKVIDRVRTMVYEERAGVNRASKEKRSAIEQLSASLPPEGEDGADADARLTALDGELAALRQRRAADETRIRERSEARAEKVRSTYRARIEELQAQIAALKEEGQTELAAIEREEHESIAALNEPFAAEETRIAAEVAALRERAKSAAQHQNTRALVERYDAEARRLEDQSRALTAALARLDALKLSLAEQIPVPGLEIRDGALYLNGVPFERANRAEQVKALMRLAKLRAGELPLVCVDGLECLDHDTFAAFVEHAPKMGLQLVVTRVTDGALSIRTVEAAA